MKTPTIQNISQNEFETSDGIYKVIHHEASNYYCYFELNDKKYLIGYFSPDINVNFKLLDGENYLLVGVDLKTVVICIKTGSVLFSISLFSFFKGFKDSDELSFTILAETEDIVVNKKGLSISQIISHELEF